ncbi:MAG: branched-chain amino acid ABC transporter ATP-binding protein/permease [Acidimicrobiales bacterium]
MTATLPRRLQLPVLLLAASVLPPLLTRTGLIAQHRAGLVVTATCWAIAALSLNVLMGYAGQISLGQFALVGVGAFAGGVLTGADRLGLPFVVALPIGAAIGGAVAFLVGLPALRLRGLYLAVATIGFAYAMQQSIFRAPGISKGSAGVEVPRPLVGNFQFNKDGDFLAIALVILVLIWQIDRNLSGSKLGRAFHAIRTDEAVAASFGVDVARYKLLAFVISGAMADAAGALWGANFLFVNSDSFPFDRSLALVIIVVIGGLGSRAGVIAASMFYVLFPELLITLFGTGFHGTDLIVGSALLLYTVSRHPGGLAEAVRDSRARKADKAAKAAAIAAGDHDEIDEGMVAMPKLPNMPRPTGLPERAAVPDGTPLLRASGVNVSFGGLQAVDDAGLEVHKGRIVGLIGPNGAGKTTLFNAITGHLRPDAGSIELFGRDVSKLPSHARAAMGLGRTFQLIGLARDRSVTENLLLAQHIAAGYSVAEALLRAGRTSRIEREMRDRAAAAVDALGFEQYRDTQVRRLSHGQQRIVELGCVLVTAPDLVLLDEPSAGMAPAAVENLAVRLRDLRDELDRTVLLIEHNIPLVLDVCDELYVLAAGRVIAHGPPAEVVQTDAVITAYLGDAPSMPLPSMPAPVTR